jgi:hypothetical protein
VVTATTVTMQMVSRASVLAMRLHCISLGDRRLTEDRIMKPHLPSMPWSGAPRVYLSIAAERGESEFLLDGGINESRP